VFAVTDSGRQAVYFQTISQTSRSRVMYSSDGMDGTLNPRKRKTTNK